MLLVYEISWAIRHDIYEGLVCDSKVELWPTRHSNIGTELSLRQLNPTNPSIQHTMAEVLPDDHVRVTYNEVHNVLINHSAAKPIHYLTFGNVLG